MPALTAGLLCAGAHIRPGSTAGGGHPCLRLSDEEEKVHHEPVMSPVHPEKQSSPKPKSRPPGSAAEKLPEQRSPASWDRKESPAAPLTPPTTLKLLSGLGAGVWPRAGQGPEGLPTGRWLPWQRLVGPRGARPSFVQAENKGLSRGVIQAEGRRMVRCREAGSHGGDERAQRAWLARGLGFRPALPGRQTVAGSQ